MKLAEKRFVHLFAIAIPMVIATLLFQNCGQPGQVSAQMLEGWDYNDDGILVQKQQSEKTLSSADAPPLKLVFIMDNSNSMTLNNLNLQQSITSMFDSQTNNLSQFNAEMFFLTTSQLPSLSGSFSNALKAPESLVGSAAQVNDIYRNPFTGQIAGDLLGFVVKTTSVPESILKEYKAQPVVMFEDTPQGLGVNSSIKYRKGSSIEALKAEVAARLNVISPEKASQMTDASVFPALDTESGLCALGRILRYPENYILPGDVTSFVVVSDENEANVSGSSCLGSQRRDFLYKLACVKRTPASVKKETRIRYATKPGVVTQRTDFTITGPDVTRSRVITSLRLTRNAKNAVCNGRQEKNFTVNHSILNKSFRIGYTKRPKIGEREGGIPIYGSEQTGLFTAGQTGLVPSDCATNLSRLQSILTDTTSVLKITSCAQNSDTSIAQSAIQLKYSDYAVAIPNTGTVNCTPEVLAVVNPNNAKLLSACTMTRSAGESIAATALSALGFSASSSENDCKAAVTRVCTDSAASTRNCTFVSYSAQVLAETRGPITVTQDTTSSCDAMCSQFPGLCSTNSPSTSVRSFASSLGFTCTATTSTSSETYTQSSSPASVTINGSSLSCDSLCSQAPSACGGSSSMTKILAYNKSCSSIVSNVPGGSSQTVTLATVLDANFQVTCSTICSNSGGACTSTTLSLAQHIEQNINGLSGSCSIERLSTNVAEQVARKDIIQIHQADLASRSCDPGYTQEGAPILTSDFQDSSKTISEAQTLPEFILSRLRSAIGTQAATISAFITPMGAANAGGSTSYGEVYEQLVNSWGRGTVQDIRSPSYAPALTQLSQVLRAQLLRSVNFPNVLAHQRIRQVWKKGMNAVDWGSALDPNQWSASGGTVTLDASVLLEVDDQIRIEFY